MIQIIKYISIYSMVYFYINVGIKHFTDPVWFQYIIPSYLSFWGLELVYLSGAIEIILGILLFII